MDNFEGCTLTFVLSLYVLHLLSPLMRGKEGPIYCEVTMWQPNHLEMYLTGIYSTLPQEPQIDPNQTRILSCLLEYNISRLI
ncbi:hypothetical protein DFP73DRAFT_93132 [Morchella snyderi]|nr:hypothetical protein DFP73DRAFT_93132 [Morchella snyderi]